MRTPVLTVLTFAVQVVFISTCRSFWDCGSVALDDISVNLGDCELTAGTNLQHVPNNQGSDYFYLIIKIKGTQRAHTDLQISHTQKQF